MTDERRENEGPDHDGQDEVADEVLSNFARDAAEEPVEAVEAEEAQDDGLYAPDDVEDAQIVAGSEEEVITATPENGAGSAEGAAEDVQGLTPGERITQKIKSGGGRLGAALQAFAARGPIGRIMEKVRAGNAVATPKDDAATKDTAAAAGETEATAPSEPDVAGADAATNAGEPAPEKSQAVSGVRRYALFGTIGLMGLVFLAGLFSGGEAPVVDEVADNVVETPDDAVAGIDEELDLPGLTPREAIPDPVGDADDAAVGRGGFDVIDRTPRLDADVAVDADEDDDAGLSVGRQDSGDRAENLAVLDRVNAIGDQVDEALGRIEDLSDDMARQSAVDREVRALTRQIEEMQRSQAALEATIEDSMAGQEEQSMRDVYGRPDIEVVGIARDVHCQRCPAHAIVVHDGERIPLVAGDSFMGFRVAIDRSRLVLIGENESFTFFPDA